MKRRQFFKALAVAPLALVPGLASAAKEDIVTTKRNFWDKVKFHFSEPYHKDFLNFDRCGQINEELTVETVMEDFIKSYGKYQNFKGVTVTITKKREYFDSVANKIEPNRNEIVTVTKRTL